MGIEGKRTRRGGSDRLKTKSRTGQKALTTRTIKPSFTYPGSPETGYRFLVLSPSIKSNALGRALFLADMLQLLGPVDVAAKRDGIIWCGAQDFDREVRPLGSFTEFKHLVEQLEFPHSNQKLVAVAVKPMRCSLGWVTALPQTSTVRVADFDDLDAELSAEFRSIRPMNRIVLHPLRQQHPAQISATIRQCLRKADIMTVSSWALRDQLPAFDGPTIRIPHPRPSLPFQQPELADSHRLRIAFLGTPRTHKGSDGLVQLITQHPFLELHLLKGGNDLAGEHSAPRVIRHPHEGSKTLDKIFSQIDMVIIPQNTSSRAANFQLPAKLLDGFRYGRGAIASRTDALSEIATDGVVWLDFSGERNQIHDALRALLEDPTRRVALGKEAWKLHQTRYSPEVLAATFESALGAANNPAVV